MTREDALALLDTFRLDREEPPAADSERMARRFVQLFCPDRLAYEQCATRAERGAWRGLSAQLPGEGERN